MNGASNRSKIKGATQRSSHVSKNAPAGKVTTTTRGDKVDKKSEGSSEKPGTYQIRGRRILDPVTRPQLTQGLSPSSSLRLDQQDQQQLSITGRRKVPFAESRPRTPVTIVGYTEGLPKGLHIVGNRSPTPLSIAPPKDLVKLRQQALSLTSGPDILSSDKAPGASADSNKPWTDLIEEGLNAGKAPSEVLLSLEDSPTTKINRSLAHNLATLRQKTGGILEQPKPQSEHLETKNSPSEMKPRTPLTSTSPIAPWRDISAFQSPNEQRRNTFNSFRLTSPDPPKSPMAVGSRQGLSLSSQPTTTIHARNREKQFYDVYNSSPAFSTATGPNRDLAFLATSSVAAALTAANRSGNKRKRPSVTGKSMTGLSLNSRINEEMLRVKKTPSQTSGLGRMIKKPGDMNRSRDHPPPSANLVQQAPRFPTVLKTTPVAMSAGKRFEQTRHIVTAGYNAATARAEIRDRYSHLMSPTAQKLTPIAAKVGGGVNPSTSPTPTLTTIQPPPPPPVAVAANLGANKQKPKPQLMPPVHVPGPKRENIYIGHYDGSDDSDSDTDLTQNVKASSNAERVKL